MNGKEKNGDNNSDSSAKAAKLKFEAEIKQKDLIIENLQKELSTAKERIQFLEQEQQKWDKEIGKIKESPKFDVIVLSSDSEEDDLDDDSSGISDKENEVFKLAPMDSDENVAENKLLKPAADILDSENEEDETKSESKLNSEESNAKDENKKNSLKLVEKLCFEEEEEKLDSDEEIVEDEPDSEENEMESEKEEISDCGENETIKTIKIKSLSNRNDISSSEEENLDSDESEEDPFCTQFIVPTSEEESDSDEDETGSEEDETDSEEENDAIDNKIKKRAFIESSDSDNHESDSKENIDIKPSLKRLKIEQSADSWSSHQMDTKMLIKQEPTWLLSQSYCNFLYRSHGDNEEEFLKACIKKLFNIGERILPENRLDTQKTNEALKIMAHYFMETKMEHHQNHMYRILGKFRQYDRRHFFKMITSKKGIIGICSNGEYFFYSKLGHRYLPYIDAKCKNPLKTILRTFSDKYAIPKKYRYVEFITIIHISDKRRHAYHLLEPATGNLEKHINNKYKDGKK